jgi:hypothetical protein
MPFQLEARLGLDQRSFAAGLAQARGKFAQFASGVKGQIAGAFGATAITASIKKTAEYAGVISDLSKSTGVPTKQLQEFEFAARQSGAALEDVVRGLRGLSKARADALGGNEGKLAVFGDLGVDKAALEAQSLEETFLQIARTIKGTDFGAGEIALLEEALGRGAMELIPAFRDGFDETVAEADRLGIAIHDNILKQLDAAGDKLDALAAQMRGPLAQAAGGVLSLFNGIVAHIFRGWTLLGSIGTIGKAVLNRDWTLLETAIEATKDDLKNFVTFTDPEGTTATPGERTTARPTGTARTARTGARVMGGRSGFDAFTSDSMARIGAFGMNDAFKGLIIQERIAIAVEATARNTETLGRGEE